MCCSGNLKTFKILTLFFPKSSSIFCFSFLDYISGSAEFFCFSLLFRSISSLGETVVANASYPLGELVFSNKKRNRKNTFSGTKLFSDNQRGKVIVSYSFSKKNIREMYLDIGICVLFNLFKLFQIVHHII